MFYKLLLYKKKNIIERCGTIDYYIDIKVGELAFLDKEVAESTMQQLLRQNLFSKIEIVKE
ncbi:MAG: hypothetical protein J6V44_16660 [Methanobrevibacter sp.]|nr:hypothetical protein [Methanobrevibacter sp.]MBO7691964.1 hypothetical protein [Methanobrevibacter sp.]